MPTLIPNSLLRAYDIRGTYGNDLTEESARNIGERFGTKLWEINDNKKPKIVIGKDGRTHSNPLESALIEGLLSVGCDVTSIGLVPTPSVSFALNQASEGFCAGIMITGSHNPPEHNGFKLSLISGPFYGDDIQNLNRVDVKSNTYGTHTTNTVLHEKYVDHLISQITNLDKKPKKIIWDCGHGATGPTVRLLCNELEKQGVTSEVLYENVDGTFPAHPADPSHAENLVELIQKITEEDTLGLAFDGDGDRLGVVLPNIGLLGGEHVLWQLAKVRLETAKPETKTVLMDVKMSAKLTQLIEEAGGKSLVWKTGHAHIKKKMKEDKSVLVAGEASGHFFFPELSYDDGLYAATQILKTLKDLPTNIVLYPTTSITPELRLPCENPHKFIEDLQSALSAKGVTYNDLDGVRVEKDNGWWLARASNTESVITVRAESFSGQLNDLLQELHANLSAVPHVKLCKLQALME